MSASKGDGYFLNRKTVDELEFVVAVNVMGFAELTIRHTGTNTSTTVREIKPEQMNALAVVAAQATAQGLKFRRAWADDVGSLFSLIRKHAS